MWCAPDDKGLRTHGGAAVKTWMETEQEPGLRPTYPIGPSSTIDPTLSEIVLPQSVPCPSCVNGCRPTDTRFTRGRRRSATMLQMRHSDRSSPTIRGGKDHHSLWLGCGFKAVVFTILPGYLGPNL